jgi:twitching motility protein PilT
MSLAKMLKAMVDKGGSVLHLTPDSVARMREGGDIRPLGGTELSSESLKELFFAVLTDNQKKYLAANKSVTMSLNVKGLARFRGHVFFRQGSYAGIFRYIPHKLRSLEDLKLPASVGDLCYATKGLILVTGPSGSGKSTTVNAMIDYINRHREVHILTIEDPIEYVHPHQKSIVNQRTIGTDAKSYDSACEEALLEDPDVIYLGEIRSFEALESAITMAETGHLVLATLHTNGAIQTLNRILDMYPPHQQQQIRAQLSSSLVAVVSQQVVITKSKQAEVVAEVLKPNLAIRALIADGKTLQIYSHMQSGQDESGMTTLNQGLINLAKRRVVAKSTLIDMSPHPEELARMMQQVGLMDKRAS